MTAPQDLPGAPARPVVVPRPDSSAGSVGTGLFFLVVGVALSAIGMVAFGLLVIVVGAIPLAVGVYRAARNLDSIAAVAYNESLRGDDA